MEGRGGGKGGREGEGGGGGEGRNKHTSSAAVSSVPFHSLVKNQHKQQPPSVNGTRPLTLPLTP